MCFIFCFVSEALVLILSDGLHSGTYRVPYLLLRLTFDVLGTYHVPFLVFVLFDGNVHHVSSLILLWQSPAILLLLFWSVNSYFIPPESVAAGSG